jgi:hypothetical protein
MAISTYKIFLMQKSSGTGTNYTKLIDIASFPDLGGAPEMLETTTLSDGAQTYIAGIETRDAMEFECNYTKEDYDKLKALEGTEGSFSIWIGGTVASGVVTPTGSDGKYDFKGYPSVYINGGGVNEVVKMTVSIAPSSAITIPTT